MRRQSLSIQPNYLFYKDKCKFVNQYIILSRTLPQDHASSSCYRLSYEYSAHFDSNSAR